MKKMTFTLDDCVVGMLVQMSRETGIPMSRLVRFALEKYYDGYFLKEVPNDR